MKQVKIMINTKGKAEYVASGYVGGECKQVQNIFLGMGAVSDVKTTPEFEKTADLPAWNNVGYSGQ